MVQLKAQAISHLDLAETLWKDNATQTISISHELEPTRKMLQDTVLYNPVTSDEMRAVVSAMTADFQGTGHWYRCVNGHPFTVGECGAPMQTSRCPQCGETVGGQEHRNATGVTHANDIEQRIWWHGYLSEVGSQR